jgi:hypothetical protein
MKASFLSVLALAAAIAPASAITVTAPANGAQLQSPFNLVANTPTCESQTTAAMGYSIDFGQTTIVHSSSLSAMVLASEGTHTLHVKCWGPHGAKSHTAMEITITPSTTTPPPPNVTVVSDIQSLSNWVWDHDPGTPGNASGRSDLAQVPSLSGNARQFAVNFVDSGGEIFHTSFGKDPAATHFIYDVQLWLDDPSSLANIEMDMNQVIANGATVIYGVQCDGYSGTWDVAMNLGTPERPAVHWKHTNVACPKPSTWEPQVWHHIQIAYSRDENGVVTYETVSLDGQLEDFVGMTGSSAFHLGWGQTLLTNFQLDGHGSSGSINAYLDKVTVSRW